jgi:PhnB protein
MAVKPVPDGYTTISPMLLTDDATALQRWMTTAFETRELSRVSKPDGTLMATDLAVGTASISICAANAEMPATRSVLYVYVPDADAAYQRALAAGGTSLLEPTDQSHGDRMGGIADPAGNQWWIASRIEDLSPEELQRRMANHDETGAA